MVSKAQLLVDLFSEKYGDEPRTVPGDEIRTVAKTHKIPSLYKILNKFNVADNGEYHFPPIGLRYGPAPDGATVVSIKTKKVKTAVKPAVVPTLTTTAKVVDLGVVHSGFTENLIPKKDPLFVPFGNFSTINAIVKSNKFYPIFVTGLSGNGKTYMIEQTCAKLKREVIRMNFTVETDEDDLIGGFRLIGGETKFFKGPVITAMERGAVLLCDEIDLANPAKVMCLQSIMEGSGYFIKKTGEFIEPSEGFTVIATANTKGKGSENGQFIGTNVLNEAFLERFPVTCEQNYPSAAIESRILGKVFDQLEIKDLDFIKRLTDWADIIRKTYADDGVDEVISTRRLIHIAKAYAIFGVRTMALELCVNRFDDETKSSFMDLYSKLDETVMATDLYGDVAPADTTGTTY